MIKFTVEALERLTPNQKDALLTLYTKGTGAAINVFVNYDLPDDYIGFIKALGARGELYGGISSTGGVST